VLYLKKFSEAYKYHVLPDIVPRPYAGELFAILFCVGVMDIVVNIAMNFANYLDIRDKSPLSFIFATISWAWNKSK